MYTGDHSTDIYSLGLYNSAVWRNLDNSLNTSPPHCGYRSNWHQALYIQKMISTSICRNIMIVTYCKLPDITFWKLTDVTVTWFTNKALPVSQSLSSVFNNDFMLIQVSCISIYMVVFWYVLSHTVALSMHLSNTTKHHLILQNLLQKKFILYAFSVMQDNGDTISFKGAYLKQDYHSQYYSYS